MNSSRNDGMGLIHLMLSIFGFSFLPVSTKGAVRLFANVYPPPKPVFAWKRFKPSMHTDRRKLF